ncbi:DUF4382 domain-containing protein [Aestuariibaculum sp. YM273]|uniref:DUF4382 domain-containing protein n=1 Tax=Aestuariibaculum sp. YM273 TaxID=3070659 RepID=UPI0027DE6BC8|nr:DUF4382 domain-containing protein [Aestuariibaculum sp. YM273]WMI64552.1 DUF4382 domain-containing protein [Aestuariibaculum sp. YM273]
MNFKNLKTYLIIGISIMSLTFFNSCSDNDGESSSRVQLKLVDASGDYEEVNVVITDIQYNSTENEDGWQSFAPAEAYPIEVDLTELISGNSLLLTDQIIPSGMMKQIRLVLGDGNTLKLAGDNTLIPLNTPSAMQSGLKLNLNTELEGGFTYTFILDWVVSESIVESGSTGSYNLKPVIKVNAEVNSGSVSGTVVENIEEVETPMADVTVEIYDAEDLKVTDTMTDENGNFLFQGLEGGTYTLKITREGYNAYSAETMVIVGEVTEAGTILLTTVTP